MDGQMLAPSRRAASRQLVARLIKSRSRRKAAATAELLDRIVDRDLELMRALPVHERARPVEKLAELVMLAQAYRRYSKGWISRRELRRRCRITFDRLAQFIADC